MTAEHWQWIWIGWTSMWILILRWDIYQIRAELLRAEMREIEQNRLIDKLRGGGGR